MRTTVAHYFQPFGVFGCDDLDARVSVYRRGQVNEVAVDFCRYGRLRESRADFLRYLLCRCAVIGFYN
jgi:hypothetical protein